MSAKDTSNHQTAVALHYDWQGAPRLTAKGTGVIADSILELAREHGVPIHEDPTLVSVLSQISLGEEIPEDLYLAIAEILAFVYRLAEKAPELSIHSITDFPHSE